MQTAKNYNNIVFHNLSGIFAKLNSLQLVTTLLIYLSSKIVYIVIDYNRIIAIIYFILFK